MKKRYVGDGLKKKNGSTQTYETKIKRMKSKRKHA